MMASGHLLVTGASSGIGYAIATRALADGWRVTGLSRRGSGPAHPAFTGVACDLERTSAAQVVGAMRGITAFVHAAGFMTTAILADTEIADGERMWRVHVGAAVEMARQVVPNMPSGGRIILIGSRVAFGVAGRGLYASVKAAQIGLARSWAAEFIARGITVNVVAPGATETPMLRDTARASSAPKMPPLGRYVQPEEVAGAVAYLLSPVAAAVTGQTLVICGGASL